MSVLSSRFSILVPCVLHSYILMSCVLRRCLASLCLTSRFMSHISCLMPHVSDFSSSIQFNLIRLGQPADWLTDWLTDWPTHWLTNKPSPQPPSSLVSRMCSAWKEAISLLFNIIKLYYITTPPHHYIVFYTTTILLTLFLSLPFLFFFSFLSSSTSHSYFLKYETRGVPTTKIDQSCVRAQNQSLSWLILILVLVLGLWI